MTRSNAPDKLIQGEQLERTPEKLPIEVIKRTRAVFPIAPKPFYPRQTIEQVLKRAQKNAETKTKSEAPKAVTELKIEASIVTINFRDYVRLTIQFIVLPNSNFDRAFIWVKGYNTDDTLGSVNPEVGKELTIPFQRMGTAERSPTRILLDITYENIVVGIEAINKNGIGAGFDSMPTQTITLS